MFALILPGLIGIAALATEAGYWFSERKRLQIASDAAAYSAVVAYLETGDVDTARTIAIARARASGFTGDDDDITVEVPSATLGGDSAMVTIDQGVQLFLAQMFLPQTSLTVTTRSFAEATETTTGGGPGPCLLSLTGSGQRAIQIAASVQIETVGCDVVANSTANDAVWLEGTTRLDADCISTPGTIGYNGGASYSMTVCSSAGTEAVDNPYTDTPFWGSAEVPDRGGFEDASISQGRYGPGMPGGNVLTPGKYGKQVEIAGPVTFQPGVYYFTNGFRATSGGVIAGEDVTFMFDQNKTLDVAQDVAWNLRAPTTGPTAGVALMGNPNIVGGNVRIIGAMGNVEGVILFPDQLVQMESGPNLPQSRCTQVIASKIDIRGPLDVTVDCSSSPLNAGGGGGSGSSGSRLVALVKGE